MTLESNLKFEEKMTCSLENDNERSGKFLPEHFKVSEFELRH